MLLLIMIAHYHTNSDDSQICSFIEQSHTKWVDWHQNIMPSSTLGLYWGAVILNDCYKTSISPVHTYSCLGDGIHHTLSIIISVRNNKRWLLSSKNWMHFVSLAIDAISSISEDEATK